MGDSVEKRDCLKRVTKHGHAAYVCRRRHGHAGECESTRLEAERLDLLAENARLREVEGMAREMGLARHALDDPRLVSGSKEWWRVFDHFMKCVDALRSALQDERGKA